MKWVALQQRVFITFRELLIKLQLNYNTAGNYNRMLHEWYIGILEPDGPSLCGRRSRWTSI